MADWKVIKGYAFNMDVIEGKNGEKAISKTEFMKQLKDVLEKRNIDPETCWNELKGKSKKTEESKEEDSPE